MTTKQLVARTKEIEKLMNDLDPTNPKEKDYMLELFFELESIETQLQSRLEELDKVDYLN